jgi:hypothetical protein
MVNKNKKLKTCRLIDVAIPADRHVMQKEEEKKLKYKIILFCPFIVNDYNLLVPTNTHKYVHIYNVCICWY